MKRQIADDKTLIGEGEIRDFINSSNIEEDTKRGEQFDTTQYRKKGENTEEEKRAGISSPWQFSDDKGEAPKGTSQSDHLFQNSQIVSKILHDECLNSQNGSQYDATSPKSIAEHNSFEEEQKRLQEDDEVVRHNRSMESFLD